MSKHTERRSSQVAEQWKTVALDLVDELREMTQQRDELDATAAHVKALAKILDAHTAEYIVRAVKCFDELKALVGQYEDVLAVGHPWCSNTKCVACKERNRAITSLAHATG